MATFVSTQPCAVVAGVVSAQRFQVFEMQGFFGKLSGLFIPNRDLLVVSCSDTFLTLLQQTETMNQEQTTRWKGDTKAAHTIVCWP